MSKWQAKASLTSLSWWQWSLMAIALVFCFTPYFLVSFVIAVALLAQLRPVASRLFASYFSRLAAAILTFAALIMGVGMYAWLAKVALHPLLVVVPVLCLYAATYASWKASQRNLMSREDMIALGLALSGVIVVLLTFFAPRPTLTSSVQFMTNGYDNGAHLSMIQATFNEQGNVYGKWEDIKEQIGRKTLTAYPQGWHLVNAMSWHGTGVDMFDGKERGTAILFYVTSFLLWFVLAAFMLARVGLYALRFVVSPKQAKSLSSVVAFCAVNLIIQIVVLWGSLFHGFAPFIAAVAYMSLLAGLILAAQEQTAGRDARLLFVWSAFTVMAIGLSWLLPVFVAGLMVLLAFIPLLRGNWWHLITANRKQTSLLVFATLVVAVPLLSMIAINHFYSTQGKGQINDTGGIFPVSGFLVGFLLAAAGAVYMRGQKLAHAFVAIVAPQALFAAAVFAYQFITIGRVEYFYIKSLSLLLCVVGILAAAPLVIFVTRLKFAVWPACMASIVALVMAAGVVVFTGQDPGNIRGLFQRHSLMDQETSKVFGELARSGEIIDRNVLLFTRVDYAGDVTGNVLSGSLHPYESACVTDAVWVILGGHSDEFPKWATNCQGSEKITVITSPETQKMMDAYKDPRVKTITTQPRQ